VKTAVTNSEGKYLLDDIALGKYVIRISGMSYHKQLIPDVEITPTKQSIKFGVSNLVPKSKSLQEVSVIGYKLTGEMEDDKTVYAIKDKSASLAQSGLDLLRQLPDIEVNFMNNEVKLAGSTNILFLVNGKQVDKDYLLQLNPKLIDKIEVNTNPGVKYDGNVDAVINIVLRKNADVGLSGRINTEIPTSNNYFSNQSASFDYFVKGIRFYVSGNFGHNQWNYDINNERYSILDTVSTLTMKQNTTGWGKYSYDGFGYGADWFADDNNMLNVSSYVRPVMPQIENLTSDNWYLVNQKYTHTQGTIHNDYQYRYYNYSLFYKHKFAKKDHEITFESNYSNSKGHNLEENSEDAYDANDALTGVLSNQRSQLTENSRSQLMLKSDYTYPLTDKIKLSEGYQGYIMALKNSISDPMAPYADQVNYDENRHSVYSNISFSVGQLNLQTGLRYEFTDVHISHATEMKNQYGSLLPFVSGQYKLGKVQTFRLNYRLSIQRPSVFQLSPFDYKDDSYTLSVGNPDLTPAYSQRFELTHRIQLKAPMYISYRPYISFVSDGIRQISTTTDSVLRKVYKNVSHEWEYGVTFSGTFTFVKGWDLSPSYTFYERNLQALPDDNIPAQKRTAWRAGLSSNYNLPKDWSIFVNYNYNAPVISFQNIRESNYDLVIGVNKLITKTFSIQVLTLNPGGNRYVYNNNKINTENMHQENSGAIKYNWIFNIRLKYNFSKGKEVKKVERSRDSDSDSDSKGGSRMGG